MSENFKFCPNCGTRLDSSARFCVSCGQIQNGSAGTKTTQTPGLPVTQDRNFLLLYIMNVRDLEVTKRCIQEIKGKERSQANKKIDDILALDYQKKNSEPHSGGNPGLAWVLAVVCLIIGALIFSARDAWILRTFSASWLALALGLGLMIGGLGAMIPLIVISAKRVAVNNKYEAECAEIDRHNREEEAKIPEKNRQADIIRKEWSDRETYFDGETKKAEDLLNDFYSMNILPTQYRNLASACYIYDYMSSSNETLESTLIHEHMENGIQRIEAKLDEIIYQLQDLVYETRCIRQENQKLHNQMAEQNRKMLKSLKQTEANTLEAAQYSQLISNDMRTVAFFETVNYLEK